jgi:hypothetical protein
LLRRRWSGFGRGARLSGVLGLLLLPFWLSVAGGDQPLDRVFLQFTPWFAVGLGGLLHAGIRGLRLAAFGQQIALVALTGLCIATGFWQLAIVQRELVADATIERSTQNLCRAYYLGNFQPARLCEELSRIRGDAPVFLGPGDPLALAAYIKKGGMTARPIQDLGRTLAPGDRAYVLTSAPSAAAAAIEQMAPGAQCVRISPFSDYHTVLGVLAQDAPSAKPPR